MKKVYFILLILGNGIYIWNYNVFNNSINIVFRRIKDNIYAPIIFFVLACNIAENTFFSIGGLGMLFWVILCLC